MKKVFFYILITFIEIGFFYNSSAQEKSKSHFGKIALQESTIPIHPGKPGKVPFWNKYAKRFIYAPVFHYDKIEQADKYRYEIFSFADAHTYTFERNIPYATLSPVWSRLPVGKFKLKVIGVSGKGDSIGLAGEGVYYRASPFNPPADGDYHEPALSYDSSAMIALNNLLHRSYVNYWLINKVPDPSYINYQYPAKIYSALIIGSVTYARLTHDTDEAKRAIDIATIVANYLLSISFPNGNFWTYFPPTYFGKHIATRKQPYIRLDNSMPIYGAKAGNAYLDLYDYTGNKKYLEAAERIAYTYLKTQLSNGVWYLYVNPKTGEATTQNITIPIGIVNYLDRLQKDYNVKGLQGSIKKAMNWIMNNPVKTFNWQGQFEDVGAHIPYKNLSREQACDVAIYFFKKNDNIKLAEELVRFAEDQFVIWEKPRELVFGKAKGRKSENWITPCVQEQYVYWMPVTRAAGIMIKTYWYAYAATKKKIYLAKAESIANALTLVQKAHHGNYSTYFTPYPMDKWLNSVVYPAQIMMMLANNLKSKS